MCPCPQPPAPLVFDPAAFRAACPAYADPLAWPDEALQAQFELACCYISPRPGRRLRGECHTRALYLLTAHLLYLQGGQSGPGGSGGQGGGAPALVSSASVDKVSVSLAVPTTTTQWAWWLSLSGYGAALLALLKSKAAGGLYVGGAPPERAGFRKAGGVFAAGKAVS